MILLSIVVIPNVGTAPLLTNLPTTAPTQPCCGSHPVMLTGIGHVVFLLQAAVFYFNHFRQRQAQGDLPETCTSQQLATSQGSARSLFSSADASRNGPWALLEPMGQDCHRERRKKSEAMIAGPWFSMVFWERQNRNRFNRSYLIWFGRRSWALTKIQRHSHLWSSRKKSR